MEQYTATAYRLISKRVVAKWTSCHNTTISQRTPVSSRAVCTRSLLSNRVGAWLTTVILGRSCCPSWTCKARWARCAKLYASAHERENQELLILIWHRSTTERLYLILQLRHRNGIFSCLITSQDDFNCQVVWSLDISRDKQIAEISL